MIIQVAIFFFSCISIWALSGKRYQLGFICGLCGQPFWIYATITAGQWGISLVSLFFTVSYICGILRHRS